jgi:hypothetical protein
MRNFKIINFYIYHEILLKDYVNLTTVKFLFQNIFMITFISELKNLKQ